MSFSTNYTVKPESDGWTVIDKQSKKVIRRHFWCDKAAWDYIKFIEDIIRFESL